MPAWTLIPPLHWSGHANAKKRKSLGLSYHTVNNYVDYLEGAFLIRRLPPYSANIRKRVIKRPKFYWRDTGLLHALLNVRDRDTLLNQPWVGASWEGFVIEQILAALHCTDRSFDAYYLRTSDQREIDLLIQTEAELWALQIKLTARPSFDDMARLDATADLARADRRFLVCQFGDFIESDSRIICNVQSLMDFIEGY